MVSAHYYALLSKRTNEEKVDHVSCFNELNEKQQQVSWEREVVELPNYELWNSESLGQRVFESVHPVLAGVFCFKDKDSPLPCPFILFVIARFQICQEVLGKLSGIFWERNWLFFQLLGRLDCSWFYYGISEISQWSLGCHFWIPGDGPHQFLRARCSSKVCETSKLTLAIIPPWTDSDQFSEHLDIINACLTTLTNDENANSVNSDLNFRVEDGTSNDENLPKKA